MILSFRSRALKKYWERNDASKLPQDRIARIAMILDRLDASVKPEDLNLPGLAISPAGRKIKGTVCGIGISQLAHHVRVGRRKRGRHRFRRLSLGVQTWHVERIGRNLSSWPQFQNDHPTVARRIQVRCLREIVLPAMPVSKSDFAKSLGISRQALYDLLAEKQPVTPNMAVRLGHRVSNNRQPHGSICRSAYDLWHAERQIDRSKMKPLKMAS